MSIACPHCLDYDHDRCTGKVWDHAEGRYSVCPCAQSNHMKTRKRAA